MGTVLFDWDGTIVDSIGALYETDSAICRKMSIPFDLAIFKRTFSPNWRLMYRSLGIPDERIGDAVAVWEQTFRSENTRPFEGVQNALGRLAAAGHRLGIVTGGSRLEVEPQLARIGIDGLMTVRVYGHDTTLGKPDPEPLLLALELAGQTDVTSTVYVGDALDDMRMAASAGARGIGIVSMLADEADLVAAGAAETAASVVEWVDRFLS